MTAEQRAVACASRRFQSDAEAVFDAWLDPQMIGSRMFDPGLRNEEAVRIAVDPQVAGRFSFVVRRQGEEVDHIGEYLEIERPRRLAFTWGVAGPAPNMSRVAIDIAPLEIGCELTLNHELHPLWADYVERAATAWTGMLDVLAAMVDSCH
jgi:uncharacterized protein YndB with AHSA1/START domain